MLITFGNCTVILQPMKRCPTACRLHMKLDVVRSMYRECLEVRAGKLSGYVTVKPSTINRRTFLYASLKAGFTRPRCNIPTNLNLLSKLKDGHDLSTGQVRGCLHGGGPALLVGLAPTKRAGFYMGKTNGLAHLAESPELTTFFFRRNPESDICVQVFIL